MGAFPFGCYYRGKGQGTGGHKQATGPEFPGNLNVQTAQWNRLAHIKDEETGSENRLTEAVPAPDCEGSPRLRLKPCHLGCSELPGPGSVDFSRSCCMLHCSPGLGTISLPGDFCAHWGWLNRLAGGTPTLSPSTKSSMLIL